MATCNFYKKNASFYYVFIGQTEIEYEYFYLNLGSELEKIGYVFSDKQGWREWIEKDAFVIARKDIGFYYGKDKIGWGSLRIYVIVRIGYYEGINLDWDWDFILEDGSYFKSGELTDKDIKDYGCYLKDGFVYEGNTDKHPVDYYIGKYLVKNCSKVYDEIMKIVDKETKKLEKIFGEIVDVYQLDGIFSNGEAIYSKVVKNE
jgi:hypothetical protein